MSHQIGAAATCALPKDVLVRTRSGAVELIRGSLYLTSEDINTVGHSLAHTLTETGRAAWVAERIKRDGPNFHITLAHRTELAETKAFDVSASTNPPGVAVTTGTDSIIPDRNAEAGAETELPTAMHTMNPASPWVCLGAGTATEIDGHERDFAGGDADTNTVNTTAGEEGPDCCADHVATAHFAVICWPEAVSWRVKQGLNWRDLHITAGFHVKDVHNVGKGVDALLQRPTQLSAVEVAKVMASAEAILPGHAKADCEHLVPLGRLLMVAADGVVSTEPRRTALRARARSWAATVHARAGHVDTAIELAKAALDLDKHNTTALWGLGRALMHVRRDTEALPHLERLACCLSTVSRRGADGSAGGGKADDSSHGSRDVVVLSRRAEHAVDPVRVDAALRDCRGRLGVPPPLHKFPRTAHLFDAGGHAVTPDDLVLLGHALTHFYGDQTAGRNPPVRVVVEEKVDGANLGVSIAANHSIMFQNRAHYVNEATHVQFSGLSRWASEHSPSLHAILQPERHILFGEWCALKHSIHYDRLPGYFLAFDLYDRVTGQFATRDKLHHRLRDSGIPVVPVVARRVFTSREDILSLLDTPSKFRDGPVEGVYLRLEGGDHARDSEPASAPARCKLVRPDFIQGISKHWMGHTAIKNIVDPVAGATYLASCYTEDRHASKNRGSKKDTTDT
eukprot:m.215720 g.215720  ORF g.215720 m.215720 type:complete len:682 (-) comp28019_c0_seq1:17-2062(-)